MIINNKIGKLFSENEYEPHLIPLKNALLIVGYKDTEFFLYRY